MHGPATSERAPYKMCGTGTCNDVGDTYLRHALLQMRAEGETVKR